MTSAIDGISFTDGGRFVLIAGPCAIENRGMAVDTAIVLKDVCQRLGIPLVFKASFDKANRTSGTSPRGVGMEEGLAILREVKETLGLPILTDVHETWQCEPVAAVADILQIPAFLSRQTDLLQAAARTGRMVNVKKGQFMAPWDMQGVVGKIRETGNNGILLTERGTSFGYGRLVVDMTSLVEMRRFGCPIVFDATHAVQKPSSQQGITGGNRAMVPHLMRAALAVGVDALFIEVHPDPDKAISDAANQLRLADIETILRQAVLIDDTVKQSICTCTGPSEQPEAPAAKAEDNTLSSIRLLLTDVDGVLTDGGMYYANSGDELKRFNVKDGMGLQLLQQAGIRTGIITSETTPLMERRAAKIGVDHLAQGRREGGKLKAAQEICRAEGLTLQQTAYIGDDVNCTDLLQEVGYAACPADAVAAIKSLPGMHILTRKGGKGCVRELCELIINSQHV